MRTYAIGDIHGQLDMLRAAHDRIAKDRELTGDRDAPVVHLGDYTDRGPDSKGVLDFLIEGQEAGEPWVFVKGNHDRLFLGFVANGDARDDLLRRDLTWLSESMGGIDTLASYGVSRQLWTSRTKLLSRAREAVPSSHIDFLKHLQLSYETPDLFFCHAGIRPGVPFDQQTEDDLVWIRSPFLEDIRDHKKMVVHGHTPVTEPEHFGNRIDLDTGAGYGHPMTAAVFETRDCYILTDDGRELLVPYA